MTLASPRVAPLRLLETGVRRLAGSEEAPVVVLPDLPVDVLDALAPLLARRRDVYVLDEQAAGPVAVLTDAVSVWAGSSAVVLVGGPLAAEIAALLPVEALVVVGPGSVDAGATRPVLLIRTGVDPGDERVAASGHPVETAHLVDAFLRDPHRRPAPGRPGRACP
ncbi:hypothetical protein GCM10025867_09920 [Frondihabitans sucicola]|uniref:Uncharacterized protein n=1 Tax=Frondihabitans sucicola TaxID=1268041 RepID=A0ABM8GK36_9MICO|nr:hypothetical protein [Frondihabitans sucicola]BDZ48751.1 hypothetical protein GCM10025867_09920 [Frondihabitans sucicola]